MSGIDLFGEPIVEKPKEEEKLIVKDLTDSQATDQRADDGLQDPRHSQFLAGHSSVEDNLRQLIAGNKLPHALIFNGVKGVGKATLAYRIIRELMAETRDMDSVTRQISSLGHPDFLLVEREMDDRKNSRRNLIDAKQARRIAPFMRMTASDGGWRIALVDDADTMNAIAQNAVLKILEEPPEKGLIILICHRLGAILPTIRSRARVISFSPLEMGDFRTVLEYGGHYFSPEQYELLYHISDGSPGAAIALLEEGGTEAVENIVRFFDDWPQIDWVHIHNFANELSRADMDKSFRFFCKIFIWLIETMIQTHAANRSVPQIMQGAGLQRMIADYSLKEWIEIDRTVKDHINDGIHGHLDRRQIIIELFSKLSSIK